MKTNIFGVRFDNVSPQGALGAALEFLESDGASIIFTPNPEMVMLARKDADFMDTLNSADLVLPDGIGIVYASRLLAGAACERIAQRVTGIDLVTELLAHAAVSGHKLYFLGAAPGVVDAAAANMRERYAGLAVVGTHHGYFKDEDDEAVIADINDSGAEIVLVGLGFPRQECWIRQYSQRLNAKIVMAVGGSFDVLSGKLRRAPVAFQKLGLEWLYRLLRQPKRIFRQRVLLKFMLAALSESRR